MFKEIERGTVYVDLKGYERVFVAIVDTTFVELRTVSMFQYWTEIEEKIVQLYMSRGNMVALNLSRFYSYYIRNSDFAWEHYEPKNLAVPEPFHGCVVRRLTEEFGDV